MSSEEDFFTEFYHPEEIATEMKAMQKFSLFRAFAYLKPYNKKLNNLVC